MTPKLFLGWLLMIIGGTVAFVTGGCALLVLGVCLDTLIDPHQKMYVKISEPLLLGGIPALLGGCVLWIGRWLIRQDQKGKTTNHE